MRNWGVIILLLFFINHQKTYSQVNAQNGFIKAEGLHFTLNGNPLYASGFNAYWLMDAASDPTHRGNVSFAFQEAAEYGLTIARAWAFRDGGYSPLQYSPGSYNEQMFQGLDFVICEAKKYGVRLILSLVNNYEDEGGKKQYVNWARDQGENITSEDEFFTNSLVKEFYKNHIRAVLTRQNSFTGTAYMDDPTIMAWELINEPRCTADPSGDTLQAWISEMATCLKSIDNNHLLEVGLEGFYGQSDPQRQKFNPNVQAGTDFLRNNQIPDIDFTTIHSYPDQWLVNHTEDTQISFLIDWLHSHIHDAQNVIQKPLLFTEFGKSSKDYGYTTEQRDEQFHRIYSAIYSSAAGRGAAGGGLFWQLLNPGMDNLRDGYEIVLSENPTTANLIAEHSHRLNGLKEMQARPINLP